MWLHDLDRDNSSFTFSLLLVIQALSHSGWISYLLIHCWSSDPDTLQAYAIPASQGEDMILSSPIFVNFVWIKTPNSCDKAKWPSSTTPYSEIAFSYIHIFFFSLHIVETRLLVCVEGLQTAFHLSRARALALTPLHSIPFSFKIFSIPSSLVCRGLSLGLFPCDLACRAILVYLSSPILTTCPTHLSFANYIFSLRGSIPNPILIAGFLILISDNNTNMAVVRNYVVVLLCSQ